MTTNTTKNPFRDRTMRSVYDAMVQCYRTRHHDLIHPSGARNRGNGFATAFWRGFDGHTRPVWDAAAKRTPGYACYCAGRDIAKAVATDNLRAILDSRDTETVAGLARSAYKYTDCGAAVGIRLATGDHLYSSDLAKLDKGAVIAALLVSSIVEGVEQTTDTITVNLCDESFVTPDMAVAAYDAALEEVEKQADAIWKATHGCPTCAQHWAGEAAEGSGGDDGMTPIWDECPNCNGEGSTI